MAHGPHHRQTPSRPAYGPSVLGLRPSAHGSSRSPDPACPFARCHPHAPSRQFASQMPRFPFSRLGFCVCFGKLNQRRGEQRKRTDAVIGCNCCSGKQHAVPDTSSTLHVPMPMLPWTVLPARRRRGLFPLRRPRPLPPQRFVLAATAAAAAFTLLLLVLLVFISTSSSPSSFSPPFRHHVVVTRSSSPPPPLHDHYCAVGEFGDAMVSMLPADLPFTVFAPSAGAFRRVLNLTQPSTVDEKKTTEDGDGDGDTDTYDAVLSRVLAFSAVPQRLLAAEVALAPRVVDSVSGLRIRVVAGDDDERGAAIVANGVRSECVDVVRGETVVHVMAGVLMDAEFERSFAVGFES